MSKSPPLRMSRKPGVAVEIWPGLGLGFPRRNESWSSSPNWPAVGGLWSLAKAKERSLGS